MNNMKKTVYYFVVILVTNSFVVTGCSSSPEQIKKQVVTVSIMPEKYFVEKIAGDNFFINVMIPPGASHENYDPTPAQIANLSKTAIYFRIGYIEFENTWINKFTEIYPDLKVVNLSEHLSSDKNSELSTYGRRMEPHTWMSPAYVATMAGVIYKTITELDPENADFYKKNYELFKTEIDSLNKFCESKFQNVKSRSFLIYHPALTYYAKDFGLTQYSLEIEGKEPSPLLIRQLIDISRKENIRTILVQIQFDQSKAEMIAKETGGKIIPIDPTDYDWENQVAEITRNLSNALNN
jgi:zinc transport system substrate-binding protein